MSHKVAHAMGQAVDQQRHVVAVGAAALDADLNRHLIPIAAPMLQVHELDAVTGAVVAGHLEPVAQGICLGEDIGLFQVVPDLPELRLFVGRAVPRP